MKEKLIELLKKLGIDITGKETELKTELDKLAKDGDGNIDLAKLDLTKLSGGGNDDLVKAVLEQNKILTQSVKDLKDTLAKEISDRENAIKAQQEQAKKDQEKKINDAIEKAKKEKRIVEADVEKWKDRLTKDFDEWNTELEAKPVPKEFQNNKNSNSNSNNNNNNDGDKKNESPLRTLSEAIRSEMGTDNSKL